MIVRSDLRKTLAVTSTAVAVFAVYFLIARPWFLHWGASPSEISAQRPAADHVPLTRDATVRAVTIRAPAQAVWPWLAQIGQDRGGFYSYEVLEDLAGCQMPRAQRIHPELQQWRAGDRLWMYPPGKLNGVGGAPIVAYVPEREIVFAVRQIGTSVSLPEDGRWGFSLEPIDATSSRLIAWGRAPGEKRFVPAAFTRFFFEPAHYVMERRMLLNLKGLAEGRLPSRHEEEATVALWTLTILFLLAGLIETARRPAWTTPLAVAVLAALGFQVLTLLQPPLVIGVLLVLLIPVAWLSRAALSPPRAQAIQ
jgi:hypothetical protein